MADASSSELPFALWPRACQEQTTRNMKGEG
jgi:hypothetical protein